MEQMMMSNEGQSDQDLRYLQRVCSPHVAQRRLTAYIQGFVEEDQGHQAHIDLKLEHSLRVWEEARRIVGNEHISAQTGRLAEWAALYHDVGRFVQYRKYRTFKDGVSVNHAHLGFKTLRQGSFLQGLSGRQARVVLQAVFMHNRAALPRHLPEPLGTVLSIVRDADKVDIIGVLSAHFFQENGDDQVLTLGLSNDPGRYSQHLLEQIRADSFVDYRQMVWVNDFKLLLCSWVYALTFATARNVLRNRGQIQQLLASLPQDGQIAALTADIERVFWQ